MSYNLRCPNCDLVHDNMMCPNCGYSDPAREELGRNMEEGGEWEARLEAREKCSDLSRIDCKGCPYADLAHCPETV